MTDLTATETRPRRAVDGDEPLMAVSRTPRGETQHQRQRDRSGNEWSH